MGFENRGDSYKNICWQLGFLSGSFCFMP